MKKTKPFGYILFSLTFLIFSLATYTYATSGACSSHGGVNCSAGIGSLGANAVCNDGYQSSTSYYDTGECIGNLSLCSQPIKSYCTKDSDYLAHCGMGDLGPMYQNCIADCKNQINTYQSQLQTYNTCVVQQQQIQQEKNLNQQQTNESLPQSSVSDLQIQQAEDQLQQSQAELKQLNLNASCGVFGVYDQTSNKCGCTDGYVYANGECNLTQDQINTLLSQTSVSANTSTSKIYGDVSTPTKKLKRSLDNIFDTSTSTTNASTSGLLQRFTINGSTTSSTTTVQQKTQSQGTPFWNSVKNFVRHLNPFSWFSR